MKKKFTPDPDQKPTGTQSGAGLASNEATKPETSGFADPRDFDQEGIGRKDGGATPSQRTRKKGPASTEKPKDER